MKKTMIETGVVWMAGYRHVECESSEGRRFSFREESVNFDSFRIDAPIGDGGSFVPVEFAETEIDANLERNRIAFALGVSASTLRVVGLRMVSHAGTSHVVEREVSK